MRRGVHKKTRQLARNRGHGDDAENSAVKWKLDQHTGCRGNRIVDGTREGAGSPVEQQTRHQEQKIVSIQIKSSQWSANREHLRDISEAKKSDQNCDRDLAAYSSRLGRFL